MAVSRALDPIFDAAGAEWNVDPNILRAVAGTESGGNTRAVSNKGAQGLMQITPDTQRYLGVTDPRDPVQSIYGAAKYLSEGMDKEGSTAGALLYYHGGPGWRGAYGPESRAYVPAVAAQYQRVMAQRSTGGSPGNAPAPPGKGKPADPDDAFLAATGAAPAGETPPATGQKAASEPAAGTDDDFLARTGAAPPAPARAAPDTANPREPMVSTIDSFKQDAAGYGRIAQAAASGVAEGFGDGPLGLSAETRAGLQRAGVFDKPGEWSPLRQLNEAIINPLSVVGDLAVRGGSALIRGGQAAVAETGAALGAPQLGRDIAALPEAFPTGFGDITANRPTNPLALVNPRIAAASAADRAIAAARADEAMMPRPATNALTPPASEPPPLPPEFTPAPAGTPQSAGAAANPLSIPPKTRGQAIRDLESEILQTAEDRAQPGTDANGRRVLVDHTAYVQGVPERPLAEREFSPANALDHKTFHRSDDAWRANVEAIERDRNNGMVDLLRNDAGDGISLEALHEARTQFSPANLGVFDGERPVDASPVLSSIDAILNGPEGKRPAIARVLGEVRDGLLNGDGELEALPSRLYGARKVITDLLQKGVRGTTDMADNVRASRAFLTSLIEPLDEAISSGAPQFRTGYLDKWRDASIPIDQQEFLQRYTTGPRKVTDKDGKLLFNKVNKMLADINEGIKAPGPHPAKSLTEDQIRNIINVRNELAAKSLRERMAAVPGSDTSQVQNRMGLLGEGPLGTAIKGAGELGMHAAVGAFMPGIGNAMLLAHKAIVRPAREAAKAKREAAALAARKAQLLETRNPLTPP